MNIINDHYVFPVEDPTSLRAYLPIREANIKGRSYVAVPYRLEAAQILTRLGIEGVDSPITTEYEWPGKFKPFKHQTHTASFLTLNKRAYVLSGLGSGKTISALWAADYLMKKGYIKKALILSPLSTLEVVWGKEIFVNFPHRSFAVLHGPREKRKELLEQDHDFYIINHHGANILQKELADKEGLGLIIIDELATFRNQQSKTLWKPLKQLVNKDVWVWGMTGSPTPNSPTDAYAQVKLITPERYNGSFTRFKQDTMFQVSQYRYIPRQRAEQIVHNIMQPAIRYALRDCVDLPETIYQSRHADLSKEQAHHYKELSKQAVTEVGSSIITAVNAAVLIGKLIQASSGVIYDGDGEVVEMDFGPRLQVLKECIDECNEKVIVYVPLTGMLNALHEKLKKEYTCEVVDGSTSANRRRDIFNAFQDTDNPRILLANPKAVAHGLTLTAASTIIWYCGVWDNEVYQQANGRIVRPGQKNITNIIHIEATPVETRVYEALKNKGKIQDAVLDLFKKSS